MIKQNLEARILILEQGVNSLEIAMCRLLNHLIDIRIEQELQNEKN